MLGAKIQEYLKSTKRKQEFLCDVLSLSPASISAILNGDRKLGAEEYIKICDALGVPLDAFRDTA